MNLYIKFFLYLIPFFYLTKSRLKKINLAISWIFIFYFINLLTVYLLDLNFDFLKYNIFFLILIYNYEIGYIYNDFVSISKEIKPTIRFNKNEFNFIKSKLYSILFTRFTVLLLLIYLFFYYLNIKFLILIFLINIMFFAHNFYRGRQNILTFFLLHHIKNLSITLPFIENYILINLLVFINSSLNRSLENLSLLRFNVIFFKNSIIARDRHKFRFYYFLAAFLILFIILNYTNNILLIIPTSLILIYRVLIYFFYK